MDRTSLPPPRRVRFYRYKHLQTWDCLLCRLHTRPLWTNRPPSCGRFLPLPRNSLRRLWLSPFAYQDDETIAWATQPRTRLDENKSVSAVATALRAVSLS